MTFADLTINTEIYYTGDVANISGFGRVIRQRPADKWHSGSVDICLEDGRVLRGIHLSAFETSPGQRFMLKSERDRRRAEAIESMRAEYARMQAVRR